MKIITKQLNFKTKGAGDLIDITAQVQKELEESGLKEGNVKTKKTKDRFLATDCD